MPQRDRRGNLRPMIKVKTVFPKPIAEHEILYTQRAFLDEITADLEQKKRQTMLDKQTASFLRKNYQDNPEILEKIGQYLHTPLPVENATVSSEFSLQAIINEVQRDFPKKKISAFGFGVGYGQLLYFFKKRFGARVAGVELGDYSKKITEKHGLGVIHKQSATDPELVNHKSIRGEKFHVTYSIGLAEDPVLDKNETNAMLANAARLTRLGGKSYHIIFTPTEGYITKEMAEKHGFRVDKMERATGGNLFIKLTKVKE